jgi:small conductance mechanosensitive channel
MLQSLFLAVMMFVGPGNPLAPKQAAARPATQPAPAAQVQAQQQQHQAAPQQAPTPAEIKAEEGTFGQIFGRTRMGKLVEGKTRVTLDDVKDPLFWVDTLKDLALAVLAFIPRLIVAGLFLVFFWLIYRGLRRVITGALTTAGVDQSIRDMLGHLLKWAIMGFGAVIACNQIGVQIAALLTGVSIIGLAVGFAAKETIENFIAGIVIFWDKPFKIGDQVEIEGTAGRIQRVTFRSTRILDGAGKMVVFPNTQMLSKKLMNNSAHPLTAVKVVVGIAYQESIDDARRVLLGMFKGDERVCRDPEPSVGVQECTPASVQLALSFWVVDESLEASLKLEYLEKAKKTLDAASIEPTAPPAPPATSTATATVIAITPEGEGETTTVTTTAPAPAAPATPPLLAGPREIRAAA